MEKIEIKDVRKYLSLKSKIVISGKQTFLLAKKWYNNFKNGVKKQLQKLKDYIGDDIIEVKKEEKLEQLDEKRDELKKVIGVMEQDDEYRFGDKKYYLTEVKKTLNKYDKKKIKIKKRGLGVFALSTLVVTKYVNSCKNKLRKENKNIVEDKKTIVEEDTNLSIESAKEKLKENLEKLMKLKNEEKEILELYPDTNEEEAREIAQKKDILTSTTTIKNIKNPSEEETAKIKKSNNYKKAAIALVLAAGIALGVTTTMCSNKNNTPTNVSQNTQVEDTVENKNVDEENITNNIRLGNYVTIENGSTLYQSPNLDGSRGIVGQNGYDSETLFKVNAVIYVDENNNETSFNLVQKDEQSKKQIEEEHKKYIENHKNVNVKAYHVTPCDELGIPVAKNQKDIDLGGWTNNDNTKFQNVELKSVVMDAYKTLGGKVI